MYQTNIEEKSMVIGCIIVWICAIGGVIAMRKLEPWNWFYPIYAPLIAILVTLLIFAS